jgi:hypothetical protein
MLPRVSERQRSLWLTIGGISLGAVCLVSPWHWLAWGSGLASGLSFWLAWTLDINQSRNPANKSDHAEGP